MPEISIIVPVFQSKKYLEQCLNSILSQTFTDFELLLIDDGSTDGSAIICDNYARKDPRIVSLHQPNRGVSSARNKGMAYSKGNYIMFCDSDDIVDAHWCERLYYLAQQNPSCLITCDYYKISENGVIKYFTPQSTSSIKNVTYFELWKMGLSAFVTTKIYEKKIISQHNISFQETRNFAEDVAFNVAYCGTCKNIMLMPDKLYYYRDAPNSLMHKKYNDFFPVFSFPFSVRIPLISENNLSEYCDFWLADFINMFNYIFTREDLNLVQKLHYNQKMLNSNEFTFCLKHVTGKNENQFILHLLKTKNYYLFWSITKLLAFKNQLLSKH